MIAFVNGAIADKDARIRFLGKFIFSLITKIRVTPASKNSQKTIVRLNNLKYGDCILRVDEGMRLIKKMAMKKASTQYLVGI